MIEPYWPSSVQKEKMLDIPLAEEETFFMTKSPTASAEYTLHVSRQSEHEHLAIMIYSRPFCVSVLSHLWWLSFLVFDAVVFAVFLH